jgi:hypothetical protein
LAFALAFLRATDNSLDSVRWRFQFIGNPARRLYVRVEPLRLQVKWVALVDENFDLN